MSAPKSTTLWLTWLASRAAFFAIWLIFVPNSQRDVAYYLESLQRLAEVGPARTLIEYPTPVIWLLQIPEVLGGGTLLGYTIAFVGCMLALDFGMAFWLWRRGDAASRRGMLVWTIMLLFMGATVYLRFDLLTAVLAGAAILAVASRRDAVGGAFTAVGAALKLWPALLWPALLVGGRRRSLAATAWFWGSGIVLAVAALLYGGWARLFTPLQWQSGRGLQIESIWASVLMVGRAASPQTWDVHLSRWQAFEIFGPGVRGFLVAASVATVLGLAAIAAGYVWWLRRPTRTPFQGALIMAFVICVMIVTGKTFSPQYLMWLAGPLAAAWALSDTNTSDRERRTLSSFTGWALALTLLTQVIYPIGYGQLVDVGWGTWPVTIVLIVRNLGLVALTIWLGARIVLDERARRVNA